MSTRCQIRFVEGEQEMALIYRHCDGYPDGINGVPASLQKFFDKVEEHTADTRFDCAEYLAAKFVVWQARQFARDSDKWLDFLSVGIGNDLQGDIEYLYTVDCDLKERGDYPTVTWEEV